MSHLRIREIIDELNTLGGMTAAHHALITELVATCLLSVGPKPDETNETFHVTSTERVRAYRARKKAAKKKQNETLHETNAVYNNINSLIKTEDTAPIETVKRFKGTRLPDDWKPSESLWSWGLEKLSAPDLKFETAAMIDYFHAQSGQRGVKLDWGKTWKTWIREAVRRRDRFKPKHNVVAFTPGAPKRTWAEIKAEREKGKSQ